MGNKSTLKIAGVGLAGSLKVFILKRNAVKTLRVYALDSVNRPLLTQEE